MLVKTKREKVEKERETWEPAGGRAWMSRSGAPPTGGCRCRRWNRGLPSRTWRPAVRHGVAVEPIGAPHRPVSPYALLPPLLPPPCDFVCETAWATARAIATSPHRDGQILLQNSCSNIRLQISTAAGFLQNHRIYSLGRRNPQHRSRLSNRVNQTGQVQSNYFFKYF